MQPTTETRSQYFSLIEELGTDRCGAALSALREAGANAIEAMQQGLSHENWRVRRHCAELMDEMANNDCIEPLIGVLNDENYSVRGAAIHSLICQECKRSPLKLSDSEKQRVIASSKRELLDKHGRTRAEALHLLFRMEVDDQQQISEFVPIALECLSDQSRRLRCAAARCLCKYPDQIPLRPVLRVFLRETHKTTQTILKRLLGLIIENEDSGRNNS